MEEHDHAVESHDSSMPATALSFAVKVVIESLKGSKNERFRRWGSAAGDVPKALGVFGSRTLDYLFSSEDPPTQEKLAEIAKEIEKRPDDVMAAAGQIVLSKITTVTPSQTQSQQELESYASMMELVCDVMRRSQSSIALKGFLQSDDCVSYWHLTGDPKIEIEAKQHYLWTQGFDIYLIWPEPTPERLAELNEAIRDGREQKLPSDLYDYRKNDLVGKIKLIRTAELTVERLAADRNRPSPTDALFPGGRHHLPEDIDYVIPSGVPGMLTMFESLFEAIDVMNDRRVRLAATLAEIHAKTSKLLK
jgi:hypothetical protein